MNFAEINAAALSAFPGLLQKWLPGGRINGKEFICGNLQGERGSSLSINIITGRWADFATRETGGDPISLYAAIYGLSQGDAARGLLDSLGMSEFHKPHNTSTKNNDTDTTVPYSPDDELKPIFPVPDNAPPPFTKHPYLGSYTQRWTYYSKRGSVIGYICRFDHPDGGKDILPLSYTAKGWRWLSFGKPRPLYNLNLMTLFPQKTILIVEGEKCADAANALGMIPVTWPGGANAIKHVNLQPLYGREVVIWPDADQAGRNAAEYIANHLHENNTQCRVIDVNDKSEGWDIVDAFNEMGKHTLVAWAKERAKVWEPSIAIPKTAVETEQTIITQDGNVIPMQVNDQPRRGRPSINKPSDNPATIIDIASRKSFPEEWLRQVQWKDAACDTPKPKSMTNTILYIGNHVDMAGKIRYNTFNHTVELCECPPWRDPDDFVPSTLTDVDHTYCRAWLEKHGITMNTPDVYQALMSVAIDNSYNPLTQWLGNLTWDGKSRIDTWLTYYLGVDDTPYVRAVGKCFLIGAAARALSPGCKMDTMLILEGPQGLRKSTAVEVLFSERWFTDDISGVGTKDTSMQMLGRWVIEIAELDALEKADVKAIKKWMGTKTDKFRPPYGRTVIEQPRSCVFFGTVNPETGYLKDTTGGRRFWPVTCKSIDIDSLKNDREQIWAEAVHLYNSGVNWWLNEDEEAYAKEQQEERTERDPWTENIERFTSMRTQVTTVEIMTECLEIPIERRTRFVDMRIGKIMRLMKWDHKRIRIGNRLLWVYIAPENLPFNL